VGSPAAVADRQQIEVRLRSFDEDLSDAAAVYLVLQQATIELDRRNVLQHHRVQVHVHLLQLQLQPVQDTIIAARFRRLVGRRLSSTSERTLLTLI